MNLGRVSGESPEKTGESYCFRNDRSGSFPISSFSSTKHIPKTGTIVPNPTYWKRATLPCAPTAHPATPHKTHRVVRSAVEHLPRDAAIARDVRPGSPRGLVTADSSTLATRQDYRSDLTAVTRIRTYGSAIDREVFRFANEIKSFGSILLANPGPELGARYLDNLPT